ncbi:SCO2322 family protein [Pseudokineococcus sp. 1T1Z-3]|uniref:SCO2322 family protein n=1 Tax=Pseudokineococcus sp. 1T1Z-3 TaxID=3132745 RepID=UPI0030A1606D
MRTSDRSAHRLRHRLGALAAALALGVLLAGPATAATDDSPAATKPPAATPQAYAYWGSFLVEDGAWVFAPVGPSARPAQDGGVEGWRFATVGTDARARPPRAQPTFEEICEATEPVEGEVRVGVVLDYGRLVDAPPGEEVEPPAPRAACAQVPEGSSAEVVLDDVATLRAEAGVLCGLDGYPATTCQPAVDLPDAARAGEGPVDVAIGAPAPQAAPAPAPEAGVAAGPVGLGVAVAGALAVSAVVAAGGSLLLRRRRAARG